MTIKTEILRDNQAPSYEDRSAESLFKLCARGTGTGEQRTCTFHRREGNRACIPGGEKCHPYVDLRSQ